MVRRLFQLKRLRQFIVNAPVKVLAPATADIVSIPLDPPPTVVVPLTPNANAPTVKLVPSDTVRFPLIVVATAVVITVLPLVVTL